MHVVPESSISMGVIDAAKRWKMMDWLCILDLCDSVCVVTHINQENLKDGQLKYGYASKKERD